MTGDEYRRKKKRERDRAYYTEHQAEILARRKLEWSRRTDAEKARRREYQKKYQREYRNGEYRRLPPDGEE